MQSCSVRSTGGAAVVACLLLPSSSWACASCGCSLSTDAATGYSAMAGWRLSLEYDWIDQSQLRAGTRAVSGVPDGTELEHDTSTQFYNLGIAYNPSADWNVTIRVPYVVRNHTTYGQFDPTLPLPPLSESHSSGLGDVKLTGAYQGFLPTHNLGVQLGIKLPTGDYGTTVRFASGPNAGTPLDASLQPGTGSTDLIVGAYYYQAISQDWDAFANGTFETAVASRQDQSGSDFRPGNQTLVSGGLRYESGGWVVPQIQLNFLHKTTDQGALADTYGSAGTVAYVSPGLVASVRPDLQLYAFVQVPVYSQLNGFQLFPRWTGTLGLMVSL